jgi:hypothetical protein
MPGDRNQEKRLRISRLGEEVGLVQTTKRHNTVSSLWDFRRVNYNKAGAQAHRSNTIMTLSLYLLDFDGSV